MRNDQQPPVLHQISLSRPDAVSAPPAVEPELEQCTLSVSGMDCSSCAASVDRALRGVPGVAEVRVDVVGGRVTVGLEDAGVRRDDLAAAIEGAGYRVEPAAEAAGPAPSRGWRELHGRTALATLSGISWALSIASGWLLDSDPLAAAFALGAIVAGGWHIVPRGLRAARTGALDMNFLMTIAAVGALFIGEWGEAASAMFLFAVAQLLESRSMDRARTAIRSLMELSPAEATVLRDGREARVPVDQVRIGETVVVRPGEKLAVDGLILSGRSGVDQAPITGESVPVDKEPGDEVFAGTLNGEGALEVRSTKAASDTTLARIIHSVEEAQASRAPSQTFVDRFARVYTPLVVLSALLLAVAPPLLLGLAWDEWIYRALVLLVVACPCALVISTPVTIVSALAGAARRGILIKGGLHLENAGRAGIVALDKTGTLTEGRPEVVEVLPLHGQAAGESLALAAAAELRSEHPLARAVVRRAEADGLALPRASGTRALPGRGLSAEIDGSAVFVGSARLFEELGALDAEAAHALRRLEEGGRTAVLVGSRPVGSEAPPRPLAAIGIADRPRPGAAAALADLHAAGIRRVVMLTGDNAATARAVAASLGGDGRGIDEVRSGLLPDDKVAAIRQLRAEGLVLMVGDGVNDAPALAAADVGVAMGSAGTDVALETADIALMADDLGKLADTIRFARKAEGIIRANIAFALLTKALFVVLAVTGLATLWMAVLADMGASLLVIANGLRALRA